MKKFVLMAAAIVAVSFASCGNKAANAEQATALLKRCKGMYFLNMLFSKPQLFLYFFWSFGCFYPYLYVLQHINLRQCCCISIS